MDFKSGFIFQKSTLPMSSRRSSRRKVPVKDTAKCLLCEEEFAVDEFLAHLAKHDACKDSTKKAIVQDGTRYFCAKCMLEGLYIFTKADTKDKKKQKL